MEPASLAAKPGSKTAMRDHDPVRYDLIELLFFAYRDFVGQPDEILAGFGFGRAHHRVLHFVNRNPGIRVADLLEILRITKQSLGRVLKELVDQGFIVQREGEQDRRQRLLFTTASGQALAARLAQLQSARIGAALDQMAAASGPTRAGSGEAVSRADADEIVSRFLFAMISAKDREGVARIIGLDEGRDLRA